MHRSILILALALAASWPAPATAAEAASSPDSKPAVATDPRVVEALQLLEAWLEGQRRYQQIPGISGAILHDQELVWSRGFGWSDRAAHIPATAETIYSICSISKLFTGVAVMQQRDRGKLRLDDPVESLLPWFAIEQSHPDSAPVTVWGLLTHSSGLPRESDFPYWNLPDFPFPDRDQLKARLAEQHTLYPADTYFQYSNLGLALLGEIVAAVSRERYEDYVRRNILGPLELRDTRPELPEAERGKRLATGYGARTRSGERQAMPFFQARALAPAAGFSSTARDLARFAAWQLRVLSGEDGNGVLSRNTLREMHRLQWMDPGWKVSRGLAFGVYRFQDTTFVGHGGDCPGYRSALRIQSHDRFAAAFLANANAVDPEDWAYRAWQLVQPALQAALDAPGAGEPTDPSLERYAGNYDLAPWGGELAVVPWKGGLAVLEIPGGDPVEDLTELRPAEGTTFRRVLDDGALGDEVVFELDLDGRVVAMRQHSVRWPRLPD